MEREGRREAVERGLGRRLRGGCQEGSSGWQTQQGKTSDSMPNRNQARPIDIRGGLERVPTPSPLLSPVFRCMSWESLQEW